MRVHQAHSAILAQAWAACLAQTCGRVAAHQSGPTDRPVMAPDPVSSDAHLRRPSRHTFDIRV